MALDVTNHTREEGELAITVENNGTVDGTLSYQVTGESAATQDIVVGGAFTLPANVTSGNTIGDVYTTLYFTPEGGEAVLFDTTTAITANTTLYVVGGGL